MTDATSWHWQIFAEFREKHQHVCGTTSFHSFEGCVFHLSPSMSLPVQFSTAHRCHCHHLYNATGAQPGVFESPAHESAAHLWGIIELRWNRCGMMSRASSEDMICPWPYQAQLKRMEERKQVGSGWLWPARCQWREFKIKVTSLQVLSLSSLGIR